MFYIRLHTNSDIALEIKRSQEGPTFERIEVIISNKKGLSHSVL